MIGQHTVMCMRIVSDKQTELSDGEIAYFHPLEGARPVVAEIEHKPEKTINTRKTLDSWSVHNRTHSRLKLAAQLGVSDRALQMLECTKAPHYQTWGFPMRDGYNEYTGIRLRHENGQKWAVPGSHQGIFIPQTTPQKEAFICEGPTDTAAALTMGLFAIGRPSCCGGAAFIRTALQRLRVRAAIIIADNDDPGLRGAETMAAQVGLPCAILVLPAKDVREFVNGGGTAQDIRLLLRNVVWRTNEKDQLCPR